MTLMENVKYCFVSDDDGHEYLIEFDKKDRFYELLKNYEENKLEFEAVFGRSQQLAAKTDYFYMGKEQIG